MVEFMAVAQGIADPEKLGVALVPTVAMIYRLYRRGRPLVYKGAISGAALALIARGLRLHDQFRKTTSLNSVSLGITKRVGKISHPSIASATSPLSTLFHGR